MTVLSGVLDPAAVAPALPTVALRVGEKSRAAQLVGVNDGAVPCAALPAYESASKVTAAGEHEVGFLMKPLPFAVPNSVMSRDSMSVCSPLASRGKLLMTVSSPKSLRRRCTADCWMIFGSRPPAGRRTIPNRAGSPGCGTKL